MKIRNVTAYLEEIAPLDYQESYDNSGLIIGDGDTRVDGVLITLDCTEAIVDEAIEEGCNLVIAHHPIIFKGIRRLNGSNYIEKVIIKAIKHNIAIYAIHTNLDNILNGVSANIAKRLGVKNCKILAPKKNILRKLVVYCPVADAEQIRNELFNVGAGHIGNYDECSFNSIGQGTFRAGKGSTPYSGKIGKRHVEKEERIEVTFPKYKEREIISLMKSIHPYEEVAYQIYALDNIYENIGSGIVGELTKSMDTEVFLKMLKREMKTDCIRHTKLVKSNIKKIAICGGSGSFLLSNAKRVGADIFITADFKYHDFFDAEDHLVIADIGHYESEQFTKDLIYDLLTKKFTKFAVLLSKVNTNPIKYL